MNSIFSKLVPIIRSKLIAKNNFQRFICSSQILNHSDAYEGDGKTTVHILNKDLDLGLMINSYNQYGFRLNNNMVILGPMALFPNSVLSWNISDYHDINDDSLSLFRVLEPKIDILVIGIGDERVSPQISKHILEFMRKYKINVEILRTDQACATFNFLNAESRMVAAGMIPPKHIAINENDMLRTKQRRRDLYNDNEDSAL